MSTKKGKTPMAPRVPASELDAARNRAYNSASELAELLDKEYMMADLAKMLMLANEAFSAVSLIYDRFYQQSELHDLINRNPQCPLPLRDSEIEE